MNLSWLSADCGVAVKGMTESDGTLGSSEVDEIGARLGANGLGLQFGPLQGG